MISPPFLARKSVQVEGPYYLRALATLVGWGWIGFNGLAAIYAFFFACSNLEEGLIAVCVSPVKGLIALLVLAVLAIPGYLLVVWGRRKRVGE